MTSTPQTRSGARPHGVGGVLGVTGAVDVTDVRRRHPIEDVVAAAGVELRPSGHGFMGCCPFHDDSTASLSVAGVPDRFHCFGCGASGDVIDFVGRLHDLGFRDAVAHLDNTHLPRMPPRTVSGGPSVGWAADRYPGRASSTGSTPPNVSGGTDVLSVSSDRGFAINAIAWQWFTQPVAHRHAVAYLRHHRSIDLRTAELELGRDLVGHTGHGWNHLVDHLRSHDVTDDELLAMDLAQRTRQGRLMDTLRDRLIIPVTLPDGRVTGFVGRDTSGHPRAPKYRNPTHTATFDKSQCLYRPSHRSVPDAAVVVVEGPLDALAITAAAATARLHEQVTPCSTLGTTVSPMQARTVAALTGQPVVIALDGDPAGAAGTLRWVDALCREAPGLALVSRLPDGLDPADWLARHGPAGLVAFHPAGRHTASSLMPTEDLQAASPYLPGRELVALACAGRDPIHTLAADLQRLAPLLNPGALADLTRGATAEMQRRGLTLPSPYAGSLHAQRGTATPLPRRYEATPPPRGPELR